MLFVFAIGGCGKSDSDSTEVAESTATTSAAEVKELTKAFRDQQAQEDQAGEERDECAETASEADYREDCAEPWAELIAVANAEAGAIVNELKSKVGPGCRAALEGGNQYIPIDVKKIGACSADVGGP
jgi:hypothetical protein